MPRERLLGFLILADVLLSMFSITSNRVLEFLLPAPLRAYAAGEAAQPASLVLTGMWVGVIAATVVSWIGLLKLLRAARPLYLASWVGYLILALLGGPVVQTSFEYAGQMLLALVGGIIVGVVYFSDLRTKFRAFGRAREARGAA